MSGRHPSIPQWLVRPDQLGGPSVAGTFALKFIEVANLEVHAYYAMRTAAVGAPEVSALVATPAREPTQDMSARAAWVQSFGRLGDTEVGLIHVPIVDQPGQIITLAIAPPGSASPTWRLGFLEQVAPITHPQGIAGHSVDQSASLPEIRVTAMLGCEGHRHSGFFALAQPGAPTSYLPSTFFVVDLDGTVTQISQAAFTSGTIKGAANARAYVPPTHPSRATPGGTPPMPPYVC
jgi:hypothetical protein